MAKQKQHTHTNGDTVNVELTNGSAVEVSRKAQICVVYLGEIGPADDPQPHDSDLIILERRRPAEREANPSLVRLPGLTLASGASYVEAGLLADYIAVGSERLTRRIESGNVEIFQSAEDLLELPIGRLRVIIDNTRHGAMLRNLEAGERRRPQPRAAILSMLAKRIKLFGDNAPAQIGAIDHIDRSRPREASAG